jgi:AGZA family xanthine/uracil permease-like MFS transporter
MCSSVAHVCWDDFSEGLPAFLTIVATPLTFSVATGLSLGLIGYTLIKAGSGKGRDVSPLIWVLTALFLLRYAHLAIA